MQNHSFDVTGYDGSQLWRKWHHDVEHIPCKTCREEGRVLMSGIHDCVNIKTGKLFDKSFVFDRSKFLQFHALVNERMDTLRELERQLTPHRYI